MDTKLSKEAIEKELYKALMLTSPGFHAIGFVIRADRFTDELKQLVDLFFEFFGQEAKKFAFIIFTHVECQKKLKQFLGFNVSYVRDDIENESDVCADIDLKRHIKPGSLNRKLYELLMKCEGGITIIDNDGQQPCKSKQVEAILAEVERIKQRTNNGWFKNSNYRIVDKLIKTERENAKLGNKSWTWVPKVLARWLNPSNDLNEDTSDTTRHELTSLPDTEGKHVGTCPVIKHTPEENDEGDNDEDIDDSEFVSFKHEMENDSSFADTKRLVEQLAREAVHIRQLKEIIYPLKTMKS